MDTISIDLNKISTVGEAPINEPERQYYYMAKLKQWAKEEMERLGRPLTFITQTFGCRMVTVTEI